MQNMQDLQVVFDILTAPALVSSQNYFSIWNPTFCLSLLFTYTLGLILSCPTTAYRAYIKCTIIADLFSNVDTMLPPLFPRVC